MKEIFLQLNIIRQKPITLATQKINDSNRHQSTYFSRQSFKKAPFQGVFGAIIALQTFSRQLPKTRKLHSRSPFTHQNTPILPYNTANSQHFAPPWTIKENFSLAFLLFF